MSDLQSAFEDHRRQLWAMCYRMTGSSADADDLVQDTFVRAMERPPPDTDRAWRPWLVRVAMNLSRDALRRRQARDYVGPWLPSPVPTSRDVAEPPAHEPSVDGRVSTAGRYEMMESISFAFLLALEALTPTQRAVLLLRDVFDYSVRETADALEMTEANVKTTLHRARGSMERYDSKRATTGAALTERTRETLGKMLGALGAQDHGALLELLDDEIVAYSDGGGVFFAARKPIVGKAKAARFYENISSQRGMPTRVHPAELNGSPALIIEWDDSPPGMPPRAAMLYDVNAQGRLVASYAVLAPDKLHAIRRL